MKSRPFLFLFYSLLFLFIFSFNYYLPRDPDLGWHLRYGEEVVVGKRILTKDTYSHTFLGQSVIDTEWLTEAVYYLIFNRWSFLGLALFSGVFTSLAFFIPAISFRGSLLNKFLIIAWALWGSSLVLGIGARPQNISLVLFSLLVVFLLKYQKKQKLKYILFFPLLFLIWANAHPGFFLGLFLVLVVLLIETLLLAIKGKNVKKIIPLLVIFLLSLALSNFRPQAQQAGRLSFDLVKGLVLPVNIAGEVSSAGRVRTAISEWLPPFLASLPGTLFFLGIVFSVAVFILRPLTLSNLRDLILLLGFIYFSTLSRRNVPFFFLIFIPIIIGKTERFTKRPRMKLLLPYFNLVAIFIMISVIVLRLPQATKKILTEGSSISSYSQSRSYPWKAIEFIKKQKPLGNMFNPYNWGGFLIWQLREYPVFIDGRVPGVKIFSEYEKVANLKKEWQEILEKYSVEWMIISPSPIFEEIVKIEGDWEKIYSDERAIILKKKEL